MEVEREESRNVKCYEGVEKGTEGRLGRRERERERERVRHEGRNGGRQEWRKVGRG